ncbi:glycoside hydrolase family 15 protein [Actinomadura sp. DC4]|uniref:glycoside hydrolase family 15 protein n=1 Tax=Actinomadura sp. DC4 TaxID=3055069 RepID=UPI0025B15FFB|nr:glycoside hydrolase family 15 protein [Actinomadura sp. DC4]MDN3357391.1 glycoside hydrolase family 15 protein [Actinomadura sp. DC4]
MTTTPIADYALVSDRHSAALIGRDGSADWLCFPRFDSPAVFGRLLDEDAGHWSIRPSGPYETSRRYVPRTMVLETTFRTPTGVLVLTDTLLTGPDDRDHRLGAGVPHLLARRVACTEGEVPVEVDYRPRPEYGLVAPILSRVDGGVTARGGAEWLVLTSPVPLEIADSVARAAFPVRAGRALHFGLHRSTLEETPAHVWDQETLAARLDGTVDAWRSWSALHQAYDGPWRELVHCSGRVLQALSFQPSGAIVAAATTSLPEGAGGERNWDYRYTWVRDASLTMGALWVAACPDEANDFFAFLTTAAPSLSRDRALQIMFGVGGEHDLSERTLPHLRGWRDSRPVRVGNGAWNQRQIDVYGELLDAALRLEDQLGDLDEDVRRFLIACADTAAERWTEKDQGIWEVRSDPQHFLYSKVMCWVALDRAIALAARLDAADHVAAWRSVREEIHDTVLREGWNERARAFTQYFGSEALDASNLMLPIVGFLPPDDPRILATIDAVAERLTDDAGLVYRYRTEDGLAGEEGTFLLCTFWLAQALALSGQVDRARAAFERAAAYANDLGLLAEEVDPETGELLGNFPQAFSHIGLVNAAWAIDQALTRTVDRELT